jgi:polar amino acid transport system ATP-binding protein
LSTVKELKDDGMTMVLATHEMGFAKQVADEVCYIQNGRILEWGKPSQILENPQLPDTREFLRRVHDAGRL